MNVFNVLRGMNLLLIDDDEWVRNSLKLLFESEGCRIDALETAEEGLALAESQSFDLIIVDYRLPGKDGVEFVKSLPRNQAGALKILITAYGDQEVFSRAKASGFHECLPKPLTSDIIESSLKRLILDQTHI